MRVLARPALLVVAAALALALPSSAHAVEGSAQIVAATTLVVTGEANFNVQSFVIGTSGGNYTVDDSLHTVANAGGCVAGDPATCPLAGLTEGLAVLHSGNDGLAATSSLLNWTVIAGHGNDGIQTGAGDDAIEGNIGDDDVFAGGGNDDIHDGRPETQFGGGTAGGNDEFHGEAGNDVIAGGVRTGMVPSGAGQDVLDGGAGTDTLDYSQRTAALTVSIGFGKNDGEQGELDTVDAIEILVGGSAGDDLTGAAAAETLRGGPGGDALKGAGAADTLLGEDGDDNLDGGSGGDRMAGGGGADTANYTNRTQPLNVTLDAAFNDGEQAEGDNVDLGTDGVDGGFVGDQLHGDGGPNTLRGLVGADALYGNGGDDRLEGGGDGDGLDGGSGSDSIDGGEGDDTIQARDNAKDTIACGGGSNDTVVADIVDDVAADCESVDKPPVENPPDPPGPTPDPTPPPVLQQMTLPSSVKIARSGAAKVAVTCPAGALGGCAKGVLTALNGKKKLASVRFSLGAGDRETAVLRFSRKVLRTMRRLKSLTLSASAVGAAPTSRTAKIKR